MLEHSYSSSSSLDYPSALVAIDSYIRIVLVLLNVMLITGKVLRIGIVGLTILHQAWKVRNINPRLSTAMAFVRIFSAGPFNACTSTHDCTTHREGMYTFKQGKSKGAHLSSSESSRGWSWSILVLAFRFRGSLQHCSSEMTFLCQIR